MRDTLSLFRDFLKAKTKETEDTFTFSRCSKDLVFQFLNFIKNERKNKVSTQNIRLTELKCYLKYASEENIALQSIYLKIKAIQPFRTRESPKEILSPEECYCIFSKTPKTKKGLRDKTFMILLYASAGRLSEIINLKSSDVYMVPGIAL